MRLKRDVSTKLYLTAAISVVGFFCLCAFALHLLYQTMIEDRIAKIDTITQMARSVAAEFSGRRVVVAASLGPYGAALHNGAEYTGEYNCSFQELAALHRERIAVLARAAGPQAPDLNPTGQRSPGGGPDLLAFETFPSLEEVRAVSLTLCVAGPMGAATQSNRNPTAFLSHKENRKCEKVWTLPQESTRMATQPSFPSEGPLPIANGFAIDSIFMRVADDFRHLVL